LGCRAVRNDARSRVSAGPHSGIAPIPSELRVLAPAKYRDRTAVGVVTGLGGELVVEGEARGGGPDIAVVGLDYSFEAGIGELVIADKNSETSGVQKLLVDARDVLDGGGNADGVILASLLLADSATPADTRAVDVGEIPRLNIAVSPVGAGEDVDARR
jgi:hypothetical protein